MLERAQLGFTPSRVCRNEIIMHRAAFAVLILLLLPGCGANDGGSDSSLGQQHEQALQTNDARSRAIRLIQIAYKRNEAGDVQGAQQSISAAAEAARTIANQDEKAEMLTSVAYAAGTIAWTTEANKLVKEVRGAIEQAPNSEIAATSLAKLSVVYGKHLGNATAAETYLKQAEEIAGEVESPEGRAAALLAIAGRYNELERSDEAQRIAGAALDLARSIEDPRRRSETLAEAGVRLNKMADAEAATSIFDEAESAADAISDNVSRAYALLKLADRLHAAGQASRSAAILQKAEDVAFQVQDQGQKDPLLVQLNKQRNKLP
jgi:tetratricopeptide (TPR) repeat protein